MQKSEFIPHRKFLTNQASFISVAEIKDKSKVQLIHFTYRLSYLKDCVLAYFIDEL
jgi:hypothetical protein